ncbi:uncharacterized protein [Branchiostoma lanceolatum]|uniref:uncharacterized protein isoform X2 n=1 Tax=Branchiostoma lanceolatum TaxID=7740 RepID=UPI003454EA3B
MSQRSGKSSMKSTTSFPYSTAELRKQRKQRKQRANGVTATAGEVDNLSSSVQTLDLNSDSTSMAISSSLGQLDTLSWYVRCLHHDRRWFPLTKDNTYAIADCDPNGQLKRGFQLVQGKAFESASGERHVLYLCSCDDAREQNDRLSATANVLAGEDLGTFAVREEGLYCLHARAAERIIPPLITEQEEEEANENGVVEQLQTDPFLAAVHDGKTYGILKRRDCGKLCCVSCSSRQMSCTHVAKYKEWCEDRGVDSNNVFADSSEANFESVSKSPVPYPWTKEMREQFGRFHWKGHVGCSLGYCMDSYSASVDIRTINSQVNEQANSGLARMKSQLSYMKPPNFMFHASLFLAVRNMDARRKTPDH